MSEKTPGEIRYEKLMAKIEEMDKFQKKMEAEMTHSHEEQRDNPVVRSAPADRGHAAIESGGPRPFTPHEWLLHADECPECRKQAQEYASKKTEETLRKAGFKLDKECAGCGQKVDEKFPNCPSCGGTKVKG